MNSDKVNAFLQEQINLVKNGSGKKAQKESKLLINPDKPDREAMDEYDYICTKKPAKKRVEKYLQGLIDEIVAENEG